MSIDRKDIETAGTDAAQSDKPQVKTANTSVARAVLPGIVIGAVIAIAAFAVFMGVLPSQTNAYSEYSYNYVSDGAKSGSVDFAIENSTDDAMLLFDSSQLAVTADTVGTVPLVTLGDNSYGVDVNYIGQAFDQSLWHAIAAAAYAPKVSNKKVAIIIAPTLFEDGGIDQETFEMRFSYSLYRAFCDNPNVSKSSREYVARRLAEQGIDDEVINAGLRTMPQDYLNDAVYSVTDSIKLRSDLQDVYSKGTDLDRKSGEAPSFKKLRKAALKQAKAHSTNDWTMDDDFYADNIDGRLDLLKDSSADETYSQTPEYDDFTFFLKVCNEVGLEPLVIICPVHGEFFDWIGIDKETRDYCYDRIRTICEQKGVSVADFSDKEYEDYFLYDIVHFGWTGWIDVEEALVDFANAK